MWLWEGEQNTNFFHRRASIWRKFNGINFLVTQNDDTIEDQIGIETEVVSYFSNLFQSSYPSSPVTFPYPWLGENFDFITPKFWMLIMRFRLLPIL